MATEYTATEKHGFAKRLVEREVIYCVSSLISTLAAREWDGSDGVDPDALQELSYRQPDADDYGDHGADANDDGTLEIIQESGDWRWKWTPDEARDTGNPDLVEYGDSYDGTACGAWRSGYDARGYDHPDGSEVYEHWIVSDWLAAKLRAHGETVANDIAGLTVWGRCTTGQAVSMDSVIERIATEAYGE